MKTLQNCTVAPAGVMLSLVLVSSAQAQLQVEAPAGWQRAEKSGGVVYTSPTLLKDMGIIMLTPPENSEGGSLTDFLKSKLRGQKGNLAVRAIDSRNAVAMSSTTSGGATMLVLVSAHALKDGRVQRMTAMWADNADGTANVKPVAESMVRQLVAANRGGAVAATERRSTERKPTMRSQTTTRVMRRSASADFNGKVAPAGGPIQSVSLVGRYESGMGGAIYYVFNPYVFYKNGLVVRDFQAPPAEINVPAFSRENPRDWGKWQRSGANTLIYWNGDRDGKPDTVKTNDIQPALRGSRGLRLNGTYNALSGGGDTALGGSTIVFSSKTLIFSPDGRFATRSAGGGGNSAVTALSKSPTDSGTYSIDGYGITLKFSNGQTARKAFIIYGPDKEGDKSVIHVGGSTYVKDKD